MGKLREILANTVAAGCVSVMLFSVALADNPPDAGTNIQQQTFPAFKPLPAKPSANTKTNQKALVSALDKDKVEKIVWTVQGQVGEKVLLVNSKGEVKPCSIGSEIDGCLVTADAVICDPAEKGKSKQRVAEAGEVQQLRKKVDSVITGNSKNTEDVKRLSLLSVDLSEKLRKAESNLSSAKRDLDNKDREVGELKLKVKDLSSAQPETEKLKKQLALVAKALKEKLAENVAKENDLKGAQQLLGEVATKESAAVQTLKRDLDVAQVATVQKESEIKRLTLINTDVSGQLKEMEGRLAQAKKELTDKATEIASLKVSAEKTPVAQTDVAGKEGEVKRLTLLTSDLSGQLKKALEYVDKTKKDITDKTQEVAALKAAGTGGQGKVDNSHEQLVAMGKKLQEKVAEAEAMSAELKHRNEELAIARQQGNDADGLYRQINSQFEAVKSKIADKDTVIAHMDIHIQRLESQIAQAEKAPTVRKVAIVPGSIDKDKESIVGAIESSGQKLKTLEIGEVEIAYMGDDVYLRMDQGNNPHAESISKIAKKEFRYDKYVYYVVDQAAIRVN